MSPGLELNKLQLRRLCWSSVQNSHSSRHCAAVLSLVLDWLLSLLTKLPCFILRAKLWYWDKPFALIMYILICCVTQLMFFFSLAGYYLFWGVSGRQGEYGEECFLLFCQSNCPLRDNEEFSFSDDITTAQKGIFGISARTAGDLYRNKTSFNHRSSLIRITPVNPVPARIPGCVLCPTHWKD